MKITVGALDENGKCEFVCQYKIDPKSIFLNSFKIEEEEEEFTFTFDLSKGEYYCWYSQHPRFLDNIIEQKGELTRFETIGYSDLGVSKESMLRIGKAINHLAKLYGA